MAQTPYHFSRRVDNYIKYRPHYPTAVLDLLKAECQLTNKNTIADIGAGTGIFTEMFLKNGNLVYGVEPDPDMRVGAEYYLRDYTNFTCIAATAESTTLADNSAHFVTAAQSFHWFNFEQAKREFQRILTPPGWVVLVWNAQKATGSPFLEALQLFWQNKQYQKFNFHSQAKQMERVQTYRLNPELVWQEILVPFFLPGTCKQKIFENPLICDYEALKGRILSNSPALEPGDSHYTAMLTELEEIFQTYQVNGKVTIEHDTHVVYGQLVT